MSHISTTGDFYDEIEKIARMKDGHLDIKMLIDAYDHNVRRAKEIVDDLSKKDRSWYSIQEMMDRDMMSKDNLETIVYELDNRRMDTPNGQKKLEIFDVSDYLEACIKIAQYAEKDAVKGMYSK